MKNVISSLFAGVLMLQAVGAQNPGPSVFPYGVASGDPLPDRVIIWTCLRPKTKAATARGSWQMATDAQMKKVVKKGDFMARLENDFTVKIDVAGLEAGQTYYYQFESGGQTSIIGRTKTSPSGNPERVRLAVVSCSNYQAGYFNAYGRIADRDDLNAVIHLGDYIYEYADGGYGDSALVASKARALQPATELLTLNDYRARYATYRLDPDLQRCHQMHPFITVWDDHESANNAYTEGAENHNEKGKDEGDWNTRQAAARKAYAEWLPIRGQADRIYRKFSFGNLAEVIMLDTRLEGRQKQIEDITNPELYSPERTLLGKAQKEWLLESLKSSQAQWKILGNQVMFAEYNVGWAAAALPDFTPEKLESLFLDIWDGYPAERAQIIDYLKNEKINDVVIVTGDVHCAFAYDVALRPSVFSQKGELPDYDPATGQGSVAVEFVTPSISASNFDENVGKQRAQLFAYQMNKPLPAAPPQNVNPNPHMKFVDLIRHGYFVLDLSPEKAQADWYFVEDILKKSNEESFAEGWFTRKGENRLQKATGPARP